MLALGKRKFPLFLGQCPEWQRGRTVTPLATAFAGSSPAWPTLHSVETKGECAIYIDKSFTMCVSFILTCLRSSGVERILGKNEVMGSIPIEGSIPRPLGRGINLHKPFYFIIKQNLAADT